MADAYVPIVTDSEATRPSDDEVGARPKYRPTSVVSLAGPLDMRTAVKLGDDRIVRALGGTPEEVPERYTSVDPIQNFVLLPDTNHVTIVDPAAPAFTRVLETVSRAAHNAHHD
ncbi:hypothetical protein [Gordonia alkaliphila]|uniref:hypothetical protein n=1 Tax=Gordonia alkaliphila TaxID=1053547 RepID=UPI003557D543